MMKSFTLNVVGEPRLHCAGCEQRVVRALSSQPGVRQVRADASSQQIEVLFDNSILEEAAVIERIQSLGYVTEKISD